MIFSRVFLQLSMYLRDKRSLAIARFLFLLRLKKQRAHAAHGPSEAGQAEVDSAVAIPRISQNEEDHAPCTRPVPVLTPSTPPASLSSRYLA